ncbi:MAG: abortive infection family protein [Bacteroidales bacterium]|nr:abortive infection family protein [Bacteroidales bacterium]
MDLKLLINRKIINVLIGDTEVFDSYTLPYMSGPDLCTLCTSFGLPKTYTWVGVNKSRWEYMQDLLKYLDLQERVPEFLSYLFQQERFENLTAIGAIKAVDDTYKAIVKGAIDAINAQLVIAKIKLGLIDKKFVLASIGEEISVETPNVKIINSRYIQALPDRIKDDLENRDYDSVITKSRTLLEEVLIFIIEKMTFERYKSNGDLIKIYQDATELLEMRQKKEWDKRVNEQLGGLHKLVSSISSMRNMNSDAHGVGSNRINIKKREALLVANSSMMLAEYWLSVYEKKE